MKFCISFLLALLIIFPAGPIQAESPPSFSVVQAKGTWRSVRTNNLFVIGNADAETVQQVAVWLEFFHGAFLRLVSRIGFDSSVPTTVIVFRDDASFTPFKPLYQGRPANLAGYFQPGDDTNYIAIALDPGERVPYSTAFHEYIHLHLKDSLPTAPLWLNEGLAELYGAMQFSRGEMVLGAPVPYVGLLRRNELLPLTTLFAIDNTSPHYNEQDKSGIFYGESWALVHYLMFGADGGRQQQFRHFLQNIARGDSSERALENSFGKSIDTIERELRAYVERGQFPAQRIASADNPHAYAAYTATQRSALSEGETNYYLGDLLLHINRPNDAEVYFKQAIAVEPTFIPTYASLARLYVLQRRYADAKKYLQRATQTPQNHEIHYLYAYVLSREGMSPSGWVREYPRESVAVMREQLLRSIKLAPAFAPAYYLLALVDLVANENLDEATAMARKAKQLEPSKASHSLLLAQIYKRTRNFDEARSILEPLIRNSDSTVRSEAQSLLDSVNRSETVASGESDESRNATSLGSAITAEPVQLGTTRMLIGGSDGGSVVRDGQTIEQSDSLPALDEVLARYVQALGGADAIRAANSRVIKGTLDVVGVSRGGSFEIHAQAPNKVLTLMQAHPLGAVKVGYNGRSGWHQGERASRLLKGTELAALQRDADFYGPLNLKQNFAKVTLLGTSRIGYREVYVLELQPGAGSGENLQLGSGVGVKSRRGSATQEKQQARLGPAEKLFLDAKTYLPVRMNAVRMVAVPGAASQGAEAAVPVEIYFDDWRMVDGINYPFRISQSSNIGQGSRAMSLNFNVTEIRHSVPVSASVFEMPK